MDLSFDEKRHLEDFNIASCRNYPYPHGAYRGRGIVICGGVKHLPCLWVCINMLRQLNCVLPIELWHFKHEFADAEKELFDGLNVAFVNATSVRELNPVRILNGWELKPFAIIHSAFEEVLLLDADNVPIKEPAFLFETKEYASTGAIFWPDYGRLSSSRKAWAVTGVLYKDEPEFESGQILINKSICWKALQLTMYLNEWSDYFYSYIHGDKETFHLAWRKVDQSYSMPSRQIDNIGGFCMGQHDFQGRRIFQHCNMRKWKFRDNTRNERFLLENECFQLLENLPKRILEKASRDWSSIEWNVFYAVCRYKKFLYARIGCDKREMEFLDDGTIGQGSDKLEQRWSIVVRNNIPAIAIFGIAGLICTLDLVGDGIFCGQWCQFEKMKVQLVSKDNNSNLILDK